MWIDESGEFSVRYIKLPQIPAVTLPNGDGTFDIYINSNLSYEQMAIALDHELAHIKYDHFYQERGIAEVEAEAVAGNKLVPRPKGSEEADFAITVSGDGMEPLLKDNSIAYVERTIELRDGDVGLFEVDNRYFIRIYFKNDDNIRLLSYNRSESHPDWTLIKKDERDLKILGRVLVPTILNRRDGKNNNT